MEPPCDEIRTINSAAPHPVGKGLDVELITSCQDIICHA